MRWCWALALLVACKGEPLCGLDEVGDERPVCSFEDPAFPAALEKCPGDTWATSDCRSCVCDDQGEVQCTEQLGQCAETET